jgi:hypothetical protein
MRSVCAPAAVRVSRRSRRELAGRMRVDAVKGLLFPEDNGEYHV